MPLCRLIRLFRLVAIVAHLISVERLDELRVEDGMIGRTETYGGPGSSRMLLQLG